MLTAIITRIVFLAGNHYISRNSLWFILLAVGLAVANIFLYSGTRYFPVYSFLYQYLFITGWFNTTGLSGLSDCFLVTFFLPVNFFLYF